MDELAAQYGYAAAFFNSNTELKGLIDSAVREQWTPDKFRAKLMATTWYRSTSSTARVWQELEGRDPVEAQTRINNQMTKIQMTANKQGISITAARLKEIARDSLVMGYPDDKLNEVIGSEWHYTAGGGSQGGAALLEDKVRTLANDYGVNITDAQVGEWVGGALTGKYTEDHFHDFARDMARSRYPGLSTYLDQGMTVKQVAAPYLQSYSQILEQNPDTVNLNDTHVQKALQGTPAANNQPPQMQTLYDFEKGLRQDPRWMNTKGAHQQMQAATSTVLRDFGIVS